ncbi:hypothetical protein [Streptomyces sp. NPDC002490]|uniref:hypothetical protein n=1 Tax=Streptomyces sp. NPDC002490 TaxID=3154416 RepID=UPI00331DC927
MKISDTKTSKPCAVVVGLALFALMGCSAAGDSKEQEEDSVAAGRLCGGVLSKEAGKALELITDVSRFRPSADESTVRAAARNLVRAGESSVTGYGDVCRISSPLDDFQVRSTWRLSNVLGKPMSPTSRFTKLPMGEGSGVDSNAAFLTFACYKKDDLKVTPDYVTIDALIARKEVNARDDLRALKDAYGTLVHSLALAMAKELGCKDNGGLKPEPSLTPA